MANIADPDQTAPLRSSLIWVNIVCSATSVQIFRTVTEQSFDSLPVFIIHISLLYSDAKVHQWRHTQR